MKIKKLFVILLMINLFLIPTSCNSDDKPANNLTKLVPEPVPKPVTTTTLSKLTVEPGQGFGLIYYSFTPTVFSDNSIVAYKVTVYDSIEKSDVFTKTYTSPQENKEITFDKPSRLYKVILTVTSLTHSDSSFAEVTTF